MQSTARLWIIAVVGFLAVLLAAVPAPADTGDASRPGTGNELVYRQPAAGVDIGAGER